MDRGALDHPLEPSGRRGLRPFDFGDEGFKLLIDEMGKGGPQRLQIDAAGFHYP